MEAKPSDLIVKRARAFRRNLTAPEVMLWSRLMGRGRGRPVFRRQHPFEKLILDFYCPAARLAVEIDGATHWDDAKRASDARRDAWLAGRGIDVLRVGAGEVYANLGGVVDAVLSRAEERISTLRRA